MNLLLSLMDIFSQDPVLRSVQLGLLAAGSVIVFLLLFTTRDILLRTHSFLYQVSCIVLVALLPGIGFFVYLLIRPARTLKEREMEAMIQRIAQIFAVTGDERIEAIEGIDAIEEDGEDEENEEDDEGQEDKEDDSPNP